MSNKTSCFGEIVSSATLQWEVATWKHDEYPGFGSCVLLESGDGTPTLCACVTQIQTGSSEANRVPQPLQKNAQELARDYPHIYSFLQTTLTCTPLGYLATDRFTPKPSLRIPTIHGFVRAATAQEIEQIITSKEAFALLFCAHQPPLVDTLILAILRSYCTQRPLLRDVACAIARDFAYQCNNDNFRIQSFISSLEELIDQEPHV